MLCHTLGAVFGDATVAHQPFRDKLADRRSATLLLFYFAAILTVIAISLVGRIAPFHTPLSVLAIAGAAAAILLLLRFLRLNDEHERQVNYRALRFAFAGTLTFTTIIGFLQSFGFHPVSWLGIPALMIILWSIGLILHSWRYR